MSTDPREFEHPIDECNHPTPSQLPTVLGVGSLTDPAVDAAADALQHWMLPGVSAHAVAIAALSAAAPIIAAQAKAEALRAVEAIKPWSGDYPPYDNGYNTALQDVHAAIREALG